MSFSMSAHATGNSPTFASSNKIANRARTTAFVSHSSSKQWTSGTTYRLEDMSSVISEVVNRPDWTSGNALSVILKGAGGSWGRKYAHSFNSSAAAAPRLIVTYQMP